MKYYKNDIFYVEKDEFNKDIIPLVILEEINNSYNQNNDLLMFKNSESINYISKMSWVLDYNSVRNCSSESLERKINCIKKNISKSKSEEDKAKMNYLINEISDFIKDRERFDLTWESICLGKCRSRR